MSASSSPQSYPPRPRRRRLSTRIRPRVARWYAFGVIAAALAVLLLAALGGHTDKVMAWLVPGGLVALGIPGALGVLPLPPRDTLDEAWLAGDELWLRRGRQSVRAPLANIGSVDAESARNLVYVVLRTPCVLGNSVRFRARPRGARQVCRELEQCMRTATGAAP